MQNGENLYINFIERYPLLSECGADILRAADIIASCYRAGGKVLVCGNGGSSADSAHIAGELLKGFLKKRPLPPAIAADFRKNGKIGELIADRLQGSLAAVDLTAQQAVISAVANDTDPALAYAQQVWGLGRAGDVLIGISTSGNARNVLAAGICAKALGMKAIALTGRDGGEMAKLFDISVRVPADCTPEVQELHLPVYHLLCAMTEETLFPGE